MELLSDKRGVSRQNDPDPAIGAALRCDRLRRRGDANSVTEMLGASHDANVKTFALGNARTRKSALHECGCVVVDPIELSGHLQVLECPTHAALQTKLRRRQTDRH